MDLAVSPINYAVILGLIAIQFTSFYNAVLIMLFAFFIPFTGHLIAEVKISGLKLNRVLILPFFFMALRQPARRKLQFDKSILTLICISILALLLSDHIRRVIQIFPLGPGMDEPFSAKNQVAKYLDILIFLFGFFYFTFTRLRLDKLKNLVDILILLMVMETLCILYLAYENPAMVMQSSSEFDKSYLWNSKFFGHKNNWGILMVLFVFITLARYLTQNGKKLFYRIALVILVCGVGISLSRQAYVTLAYGFLLIIFWQKDFKSFGYLLLLVIALIIIQPEFIFTRMESMLSVSSAEEFQSLNTKVGDEAFRQMRDNFALVPQMFFSEWEYNWSEGFWNGMMHQLGMLGLFFFLYMYISIFFRYRRMFSLGHKKLKTYASLGMLFIVIMVLSNFNRRGVNFNHYNGMIEQIGFTTLFMLLYIELLYHGLRQRVKAVQYF